MEKYLDIENELYEYINTHNSVFSNLPNIIQLNILTKNIFIKMKENFLFV